MSNPPSKQLPIVERYGVTVQTAAQFSGISRSSAEMLLTLTVRRGGQSLTFAATPERRPMPDLRTGKETPAGYLGIVPASPVIHVRFSLWEAVHEGARRTGRVSGQVLGALKGLVTGQIFLRELGGPIRIGQVSGEAASLGVGALVGLMAVLSVNLAILNLLPIPVLDGGGLVLLLAELVRRRPLSLELRTRITNAGLIVVAALMLFAISNDVFGLFRR